MLQKRDSNAPSVGAFYQCYKQPKAFMHVLKSFRSVYPKAAVVVVSDGGYDYRKIAEDLGCVYRAMEHQKNKAPTHRYIDEEDLVEFLWRLVEAARVISDDYIMLLEDDVWVLKPATDLRYDLNGVNKRTKIGPKATLYLKSRTSHIPADVQNYHYGGCGGTIVKKKFILDHFGDIEAVRFAVRKIREHSEGVFCRQYDADYYLSNMILFYGGSIGPYAGFCETFYRSYLVRRYVLRNIETLHQYKEYYE
jgi:hypothetical protein